MSLAALANLSVERDSCTDAGVRLHIITTNALPFSELCKIRVSFESRKLMYFLFEAITELPPLLLALTFFPFISTGFFMVVLLLPPLLLLDVAALLNSITTLHKLVRDLL